MRDSSIDLLRIVCCLMVVAIHVTPTYSTYINMDIAVTDKWLALVIQSFVRGGLPIFFIISGFYLLNSKIDCVTTFYKKRMIAVIIPFIIFSFIHHLTLWLLKNDVDFSSSFILYLNGLKTSTGVSPHFWFVYSIIGLYVITPILSIFIRSVNSKNAIPIIIFLLAIKAYWLYIKPFGINLSIPDIDTWMLYFLIGGVLGKINNINKQLSLCALLLSLLLSCSATYIKYYNHINIFPFDSGINMYLFSIFMFIFFRGIELKISKKTSKIIASISSCTYGVYLIHIAILFTLKQNFNMLWYKENYFYYTLSISVFVFIISIILTYIINKLITNPLMKVIMRK